MSKTVKKLVKELSEKNWKSSILKDLLRKIDQTGDVQPYPGIGRPRIVRIHDYISTV